MSSPDDQQDLEARLERLEEAVAEISSAVEKHALWLDDLASGLGEVTDVLPTLGASVEGHGTHLQDLSRWLAATEKVVSSLSSVPVLPSPVLQSAAPAAQIDDRQTVRRQLRVWAVSEWLDHASVESTALVTVVIPSRNRAALLERAIASVLAQRHEAFELIVVDDGSTDDTPAVLQSINDSRVRTLRADGGGQSAARNLAVREASGSMVAYLDDDNLMHPSWLRAVAWAFERWPDADLLYGARVVEDSAALVEQTSGAMPSLEWHPFDRARLELANFIDISTVAHRAGLPDAEFDESLRTAEDWDLLLRLSARSVPLELPAIACFYATSTPGRASDLSRIFDDVRRVRARAHTTRPLRVVVHASPDEACAGAESKSLADRGAEVEVATTAEELVSAVERLHPDLALVYGSTASGPGTDGHSLPFAIRRPSSETSSTDVEKDPRCIGVWDGALADPDELHDALSDALMAWRVQS